MKVQSAFEILLTLLVCIIFTSRCYYVSPLIYFAAIISLHYPWLDANGYVEQLATIK